MENKNDCKISESNDYVSKWHRELEIFSKIKSLIMLEGNVFDIYPYPHEGNTPKGSILRLTDYLYFFYKDLGYKTVIFYDTFNGFYNAHESACVQSFAKSVGAEAEDGRIATDFKTKRNSAAVYAQAALSQSRESTVIVMNLASRYIVSPDNLTQPEVDSFAMLQLASLDAKDVKTDSGMLKNLIVAVVNKVNDYPAWFYLDNPNVKPITIGTPSTEEREQLIKGDNFATFFNAGIYSSEIGYYTEHSGELEKIQNRFVALTDGFGFTEINGLRRLAKNEKIHIRDLCDVVDLYKYGIKENPWKSLDRDKLTDGHRTFEKRVKGQETAITKTLDVVKRAITGMSGLQGSAHAKPKGVLFFAGPTGTGKTETAKTLAELLFGDESCCIRFDMSEYGQSHSDQRLLGAPPGYIGYEAGGQLTNAVRNNPFSILLFDEIEKAHPTILDKFLQILEDGRMTDGQGNTVYFSECVIIFTSNLGIYTRDSDGTRTANVNMDMSYEEVEKKVRVAIENYFKLELGRPEILNRIGENIVVFDYIRPDVAELILNSQIKKIIEMLSVQSGIALNISAAAHRTLLDKALANLQNGGRGIGNIVESSFINPLARFIFDNNITEPCTVDIEEIKSENGNVYLYGKISR